MTFEELLDQAIAMLQRRGRLTYRTLKLQFKLDDETLEALKDELLYSHPQVVDDAGRGLVWIGETVTPQAVASPTAQPLPQPAVRQEPLPQAEPQHTEPPTPDGERRQLTVMFCDLADSTKLSGQLDPEDLRDVIRAYQATAADVIQRYEGYIAQYLGDGLLVYFGWPQAHEDDPQRGVYAGLGIVEAVITTLNPRLDQDKGVRLAVRVGIHTGPIVMGEMGGRGRYEQLALGETTNIAARLEGLAQPNTVVISDTTYRLVEGYYHCNDLGTHSLKGVAAPMCLYEVRQTTGIHSRLDAARQRGLIPLVGREQEVGLLLERWEQAKEGQGQVILLSGEAGIGKSRLVQVLKEHLTDELHIELECRSSPYYQNSTLYPIIDLFQRLLQWQQNDTPEQRLEKLEQSLGRNRFHLEETVPLLAALLSLPLSADRYPLLQLTPQYQRQKTLEIIVAMLLDQAEHQPMLFILEDLHWTDPSTLELLRLLFEQVPGTRMMILTTLRPTSEPSWSNRSYLTSLTLNRLGRAHVETLIERCTGGKPLPPEVLEQIITKTDGVPLFIEELVKMIVESGLVREAADRYILTGPLPPLAIPATLQDSLMARLDRLSSVKAVAQFGAVLGREFSYELLQATAPIDEPALQQGLDELVEAELIYQRGRPPQATYRFKHALIRDAAYQSLLKSTRQQVHRQVAQAFEVQFSEIVQNHPELIAHHYTEAGCYEEAIPYWRVAGIATYAKFAYQEAVIHFGQALDALEHLPESCAVMAQAIDLRLELRRALLPLRDLNRELSILREAETLAIRLNDPQRIALVTSALSHYLWLVGDLEQALTTGQHALALIPAIQDEGLFHTEVNATIARVYFSLGQCGKAIETFRLVLDDENYTERYVERYVISDLRWLAQSCAETGAFTEGMVSGEKAVLMAEKNNRPYMLSNAYNGVGYLCLCQGDLSKATSFYKRGLEICQRWHIDQQLHGHALGLSIVLSLSGQKVEALALLEQTIDQYSFTGLLLEREPEIPRLGEIYLLVGRLEEAMYYTQQQLEFACSNEELGRRAWSLRILGEIVIRQDPQNCELAESYYDQALALADELGMRPLQAHCHHGLGTLYRQTGQAEQAYAELSTAIQMYRDMEMMFWLPHAEATLSEI